MGLVALIRAWWHWRQRRIDMDMLWPACCAIAPDLDSAKAAFASCVIREPAWAALEARDVFLFIDRLESYR